MCKKRKPQQHQQKMLTVVGDKLKFIIKAGKDEIMFGIEEVVKKKSKVLLVLFFKKIIVFK